MDTEPRKCYQQVIRGRLQLLGMEFHVVYCLGTKHQAADAPSPYPTTEEFRTPIDDALHAKTVLASPKEHEKVGTIPPTSLKTTMNNRFWFIPTGFPAMCPLVNTQPGTKTVLPTMTELLAE